MTEAQRGSVFLSHNSRDKEIVRRLAAAIALTGTPVWFDEWAIRPGDSVPGAIDQGLSGFRVFALVWSVAAANSAWVRTEMDAALTRWVGDRSLRLVPILHDRAPLPPMLAALRYIDAGDGNYARVAQELLGFESETGFRLAVQAFIDEAGLNFRDFWGVGVMVACRRCGATADNIEGWQESDHRNDRTYAGARCKICGWSEGSEE